MYLKNKTYTTLIPKFIGGGDYAYYQYIRKINTSLLRKNLLFYLKNFIFDYITSIAFDFTTSSAKEDFLFNIYKHYQKYKKI